MWLMAIVFKGLLSDIQFNTDIYNKANQEIDNWAKKNNKQVFKLRDI